jgi:hypothetical protein
VRVRNRQLPRRLDQYQPQVRRQNAVVESRQWFALGRCYSCWMLEEDCESRAGRARHGRLHVAAVVVTFVDRFAAGFETRSEAKGIVSKSEMATGARGEVGWSRIRKTKRQDLPGPLSPLEPRD